MAATDLLKRVPDVGRNALLFFRRPREFVATSAFRSPLTAKEQFVWSIAFAGLIVGLYSLAAGSPMEQLQEAAGLTQAVSADASAHSRPAERDAPVTFAGISWEFRIGAGVSFPELLPVSKLQRVQFQVGAVEVDLNNVVPVNVLEKGRQKFLLALYALVSALCIHPVARVFRGRASFGDSLRLTFVIYGFSFLLLQVVVVVAVLFSSILFGCVGFRYSWLGFWESCFLALVSSSVDSLAVSPSFMPLQRSKWLSSSSAPPSHPVLSRRSSFSPCYSFCFGLSLYGSYFYSSPIG